MKFIALRSTEDGSVVICHQKTKKKMIKNILKHIKDYFSFCESDCEIIINKIDEKSSDYGFYSKHIED